MPKQYPRDLRDRALRLVLAPEGSVEFPFLQWAAFMNNVAAAYHATVDPGWRAVPALRTTTSTAGEDLNPVELADQLTTAGCDHSIVLRALRDPVDPLETLLVLELLHDDEPGSRLGKRLTLEQSDIAAHTLPAFGVTLDPRWALHGVPFGGRG